MKTVNYLMLAILAGALLSGCGAASKPPVTPFPESMKGYELYSWQDGNQWNFSLLVGTNRLKTLDEIKTEDSTMQGVDSLISALEQMPAGQYVTWSSRETLPFPPEDIVEQIQQTCEDKGLLLSIAP